MLEFSTNNICELFGGTIFSQIVDTPIGTDRIPVLKSPYSFYTVYDSQFI